jgi:hypothetical protein
MVRSIFSLCAILIACSTAITVNAEITLKSMNSHRSHWLGNTNQDRNELLRKFLANKIEQTSPESRSLSSPFEALGSNSQFKGCVDPSEPFQCPQSEQCIALQFICDGHPGDCPGNTDENEETCIAAKRPAKENIEKFLNAEFTLHGLKLFSYLFGEKISKRIEENTAFWFDVLASAFSVSKNIRNFAEKTRMTPEDLAHFRKVIETVHDGRLEEIPMFAQEAVNQGLASLIEKLYESGFMDQ